MQTVQHASQNGSATPQEVAAEVSMRMARVVALFSDVDLDPYVSELYKLGVRISQPRCPSHACSLGLTWQRDVLR